MNHWSRICSIGDIPALGARTVSCGEIAIALFRTADDQIFAVRDRCPHKGGPLSQGIVHGAHVTCPLHGWVIGLRDGAAVAPDAGCVPTFEVRVTDGEVWLNVPSSVYRGPERGNAERGIHHLGCGAGTQGSQ